MCKKLVFLAMLVAIASPALAVTYIDADRDNVFAVSGTDPWYTTASYTADTLWRERAGFGLAAGQTPPGAGNLIPGGGEIYQNVDSGQGNKVNPERLLMTIDDLNPAQTYGICIYFWSATGDPWGIRAGLTEDDLATNLWVGGATPSGPTKPTAVGIDSANRTMWQALIATVTGVTTQDVYIDDYDYVVSNNRTWFDGIGIPEPATMALLGLGSLALLRRKK